MDDRCRTPLHLIGYIANRLRRSADENLTAEKVTFEQVKILKLIQENGGQVEQKDIEKAFGIRRSSVTSAMHILENKGYIARASHPEDKRAKTVSLTPEGQKKNEKLIDFIKKRDEGLLAILTEEEKETLASILRKIRDNLD